MDAAELLNSLHGKQKELIEVGLHEGLFEIKGDRIYFLNQSKSYKITDPEEPVRAATYVELVVRYKYPPNRTGMLLPPATKPDSSWPRSRTLP